MTEFDYITANTPYACCKNCSRYSICLMDGQCEDKENFTPEDKTL